jgi:hypothetical protein
LISRSDQQGVTARPVSLSVVDGLAAEQTAGRLGMSIGDLWSLTKVAVIVEGLHDECVFSALIGEQLDSAPAGIFPIHGGARLRSLAEARLLFDGTDAQILVVLNDLVHAEITPIWRSIQDAGAQGSFDTAHTSIEELRGMKGDSYLFLHQFASRAPPRGRLDRVHVHGLGQPDVICYLTPELVLNRPEPWPDLIQRWTRSAAPADPKNLKGWLKKQGLLPQDQASIDASIATAATQMKVDHVPVPADLVALGLHVVELAATSN